MEDKKIDIRVISGDATVATSNSKSIAPLGTRFGDNRISSILDATGRHIRQDIVSSNKSKVEKK